MSDGGSYHSKAKQKIREKLWDSAFIDLIENDGIKSEKLKYFCLPGRECLYLNQIIKKFHIKKENIIAVEKLSDDSIPIRKFLNGRGILEEGKIEILSKKGVFNRYFPLDIINLDYCGQGFVFSGEEHQKRWDVIVQFINNNRNLEVEKFYLLLTLLGARSNRDGKRKLQKQIIKLNRISGLTKDYSNWKEPRLIQEALPSIIIEEALNKEYNISYIDSYRYRQEDKISNMVTFSFKFELINIPLGERVEVKEKLRNSIVKDYYSKDLKELIIK